MTLEYFLIIWNIVWWWYNYRKRGINYIGELFHRHWDKPNEQFYSMTGISSCATNIWPCGQCVSSFNVFFERGNISLVGCSFSVVQGDNSSCIHVILLPGWNSTVCSHCSHLPRMSPYLSFRFPHQFGSPLTINASSMVGKDLNVWQPTFGSWLLTSCGI
jgi:hypothetical protein